MTFIKQPTAVQHHIFSYLGERDLHFAGRSCKTLQKAAGDNRLWKPFLAKRSIEPTENNKQRLTAFFKTSCHAFAEAFRDRMSKGVKAELESQKADQLSMDDNNPLGNVVVLSRARHKEMTSKFVDIYDLYAAIWKSSTQSPEFIGSLNFHGVASASADPDRIRFLRELGVDASKPFHEHFALDLLLENRKCSLEAVKLLVGAKAGFSENRSISTDRLRYVRGTIDTAAKCSTPDVFRYLFGLHPQVSQVVLSPDGTPAHSGTLTEALVNDALVKDDAIIKMLIEAGAKLDEESGAWSFGRWYKVGDARGSLNCALMGRDCPSDRIRLLLEMGSRPTKRELQNEWMAWAGSLDIAVYAKHPKETLELLLERGATLSRADHKLWPGTLEVAKSLELPADSLQLLEEAAARGQFPPEEAPPVQVEQHPEMPVPQENPAPEEVIVQQPIQDLPPQAVDLPDVQDQNPEEEEPEDINPLQQILPAWLWNAFMAIDAFISAIVVRIVNFFSRSER